MTLPEEDLVHILEHTHDWHKLRGKRIFLTGASGFVGTWLTESFEWANNHLGLCAQLTKIPRNSLPAGDFDFGIHAAKADSFQADMNGTERILNFAAQRGVARVLFTSSGAVYGKLPTGMINVSEDYICAPESDYAKAKLAGELLCANYGFDAMIARMFAFVGPRLPLNLNFAVGNFIADVLHGRPVTIQGDGSALRSYLYAADLAIWLWTILLKGEPGRPYNVGSSEPVSISELARAVVENTRPRTPTIMAASGAASTYVPSVERARTQLNLRSLVSLEEGIRRMYAWNLSAKEREMPVTPATTA